MSYAENRNKDDEIVQKIEIFDQKLEQCSETGEYYELKKAIEKVVMALDYYSKKVNSKYLKHIEKAIFNFIDKSVKEFKKTDDINYILKVEKIHDHLDFYDDYYSRWFDKFESKCKDKIYCFLEHNINIKTNSNGDDLLKIISGFRLELTEKSYYKKQLLTIAQDIDNLKHFQKEFYFGLWHFLYADADKILKEHKEINFEHYRDERSSAFKKLGITTGSYNWEGFYGYLEKIVKSGKPILALHIINSLSEIWWIGRWKSLCNCYIEAFIKLERFDILEKYYENSKPLNQNIAFLENMAKYYISQKKCDKALEIVIQISKIEPKYHFIEESKTSIERCILIEKLSSKNIDENTINSLSGYDFESLIISKFREYGFDAKETPITGDYGADIIVENKNQTRFVIQCKRFKTKVNLKAVQEVTAALAHFNGDIGIVVTNNSFLNSAIKLAESNDIELWDSIKLMRFLAGDISFSSIYE